MISVDTNILLFAQNQDCPEHGRALEFISALGGRTDMVLCELVLVELYLLLRNPAVVGKPLSSSQAVRICQVYRANPNWRLVENASVMDDVWDRVRQRNFARRRIIDIRLALTL